MVVADRGDSDGHGWAAIDDFEFLYDVFQVKLLDASVILTITPLPAQISASNFHDLTQITSRRVCFNPKHTEKPKAHGFYVWVKAHSARGGRGDNRKHHPGERCDLRFG